MPLFQHAFRLALDQIEINLRAKARPGWRMQHAVLVRVEFLGQAIAMRAIGQQHFKPSGVWNR